MSISYHTYWRELASGARTGVTDKLVLLSLTPFAWVYSLTLTLRALLYKIGVFKTYHLTRPVVSIGNVSVGGTGKTPITAYIARFLLDRGYKVAVLSRGYGGALEGQTCVVSDGITIMLGARECGDEPYLLASTVRGLMVVIGSDRYAAGQLALQQLSPDIFLLDDGFQHLRLHRDLNILLMDYERPFGNTLTLPAGILREPPTTIGRADLVVFTRAPQGATVTTDTGGIPACVARHTLLDLLPLDGGSPIPFSACRELTVVAFAGIADPDSFFEGLREQGLNLIQSINFPDHVSYNKEQCDVIAASMRTSGANWLITTEKDGVKLNDLLPGLRVNTLLARLELTIDHPDLLKKMLTNLL